MPANSIQKAFSKIDEIMAKNLQALNKLFVAIEPVRLGVTRLFSFVNYHMNASLFTLFQYYQFSCAYSLCSSIHTYTNILMIIGGIYYCTVTFTSNKCRGKAAKFQGWRLQNLF